MNTRYQNGLQLALAGCQPPPTDPGLFHPGRQDVAGQAFHFKRGLSKEAEWPKVPLTSPRPEHRITPPLTGGQEKLS
jgi:hypothetical protein